MFRPTHAELLVRASCFIVSMRAWISLRVNSYSFCLPLHHNSGSSYLFTTYVASWLAIVLLDSVWGFNVMFTDYRGTLLLSKHLGPSLCRPIGAQEWPSVTTCHRKPGREIQQALYEWEIFRTKRFSRWVLHFAVTSCSYHGWSWVWRSFSWMAQLPHGDTTAFRRSTSVQWGWWCHCKRWNSGVPWRLLSEGILQRRHYALIPDGFLQRFLLWPWDGPWF